jgi:hypothetical protein
MEDSMSSTRFGVRLVLFAVCCALLLVPTSPAQTAPARRAAVMFSATDANGNPIRPLTKDSVFLSEDSGAVQTLEVGDASDLPLHLGIVLLASTRKFDQEQAAAIELAQKVLRPGKDEAFVVTAGGDKLWPNPHIGWLKDPSAVVEAIRGLDQNTGLPDLFNYELKTESAGAGRMTTENINVQGGFSVFDAIWALTTNNPKVARRAVVIFRLASAHSPGLRERSVLAIDENHTRVITIAQSLGVSFFTIGVEDPSTTLETAQTELSNTYVPMHAGQGANARNYDQHLERAREHLYTAGQNNVDRIADETGGRSWWNCKKNYSDAVEGIVKELAARNYVIFVPAAHPTAKPVYLLKVQVTGAAHVAAPHAYAERPQKPK